MSVNATHPVKVIQSIVIEASREQVWSILGDFFKIETYAPIDRTEKQSDKTRLIYATKTQFVTEDLLTYHEDDYAKKGQSYYSYNMHIAQDKSTFAFPYQPYNYWAEIRVIDITIPDDSGAPVVVVVVWTATCDVESEEASTVIKNDIDGLFSAALQNLKNKLKQ